MLERYFHELIFYSPFSLLQKDSSGTSPDPKNGDSAPQSPKHDTGEMQIHEARQNMFRLESIEERIRAMWRAIHRLIRARGGFKF